MRLLMTILDPNHKRPHNRVAFLALGLRDPKAPQHPPAHKQSPQDSRVLYPTKDITDNNSQDDS